MLGGPIDFFQQFDYDEHETCKGGKRYAPVVSPEDFFLV